MSEPVDNEHPYPVTEMKSPADNSFRSFGNGSYNLAIIVVVAVILVGFFACIWARKRDEKESQDKEVGDDQNSHQVQQQPPPPPPPQPQQPKANGGAEQHGQPGPREGEGAKMDPRIVPGERGDIEHGFGRGMPPPPLYDGGWGPKVRFYGYV